ncbi:MAG: DedA family protein [Microbacteriaceae bacterium]|nr:DedA family protein [Microbacteriaceae bacterium]
MNDILSWILDIVRGVDPGLRVLLVGLGMLFETSILIGLIVPGDTVVIVASTGITSWAEYAALLVVVVGGALAGESIGFALGRFFGPRIRASRLGQKLGERNWVRAENYLDRRGGIAVFISRFLPVLHALIPLTVGTSAMRYRRFLAWTAPACIIWAVAYVSVGWLAAGSYRQLSSQLHYAGYIFAAIIAVFLVVALFVKKLIERTEARHMERPDATDRGETREP